MKLTVKYFCQHSSENTLFIIHVISFYHCVKFILYPELYIFFTFDCCRYLTHLKWAEGGVETEDALLPYPKKAKSSVADARFTIPVQPRTGVIESVTGETVASTVSPEERDAWAMSDDEETNAFWRHSAVRTVDTVKQWMCDTDAGSDPSAALDDNDNTLSATQVTCDETERMCAEHVGNTTVNTLSGVANKDVTNPAVHAVSVKCSYRAVDTEMHVELSSQNIDEVINDTVVSGCNDVVVPAVDNSDEQCINNDSERCIDGDSEQCINDDSERCINDDSERCINDDSEQCINDDSDGDVCVREDTDDSDVDDAYQSSWQTVIKKDPYPVKERLLLSLEEVSLSTTQHWQI